MGFSADASGKKALAVNGDEGDRAHLKIDII